MNEALTRIRYELGRDAVIISQRKLKKSGFLGLFGSKKIEVTAAVENYSKNNNSRNEEKEKQADDDYKDSLENLKKLLNTEMTVKKQEEKKEVVEKKISEQDSLKSEMQEMKALLNKVIKNTTLDEEKQKDELLTLMTELDMDYTIVPPIVWKATFKIAGKGRKVEKKLAQEYVLATYGMNCTEDEADATCIGAHIIKKQDSEFNWA